MKLSVRELPVTLRTLSFTEAAMIRYADEIVAARDAAALPKFLTPAAAREGSAGTRGIQPV